MDFNSNKMYSLQRAIKPPEIMTATKNWSNIESYIYIISKQMPVLDDAKSLNCMKIGFSNVTTKENKDKGYARLLSFRTSLITFNVHRIYLFVKSDLDNGTKEAFGLNAYAAEQTLHYHVNKNFKPNQVNLTFSNGQASEWWAVDKRAIKSFLDFCDTTVQKDSPVPPVYGTSFNKIDTKRIVFGPRISGTGTRVDQNGKLYQGNTSRKTDNIYARDLHNRKSVAIMMATKKSTERDVKTKAKRIREDTRLLGEDFKRAKI